MRRLELGYLLLKTAADSVSHYRKIQLFGRLVCQFVQSLLDTLVSVLETEIQSCAVCGFTLEQLFTLCDCKAKLQCQPRFPRLRGACKNVQALCKQAVNGELDRLVQRGHYFLAGLCDQFVHLISPFFF